MLKGDAVKILSQPPEWEYSTDPTGATGIVKQVNGGMATITVLKYDVNRHVPYTSAADQEYYRGLDEYYLKDEALGRYKDDMDIVVPVELLETYEYPIKPNTKVRVIGEHERWPTHVCAYPKVGIEGMIVARSSSMAPAWGQVVVKFRPKVLGYGAGSPLYYFLDVDKLEVINP
jgi:hypothetical protein